MRNPFTFLTALLLTLILLPACNSGGTNSSGKPDPTPEEILTGSWKLKSLNMGDQAPPPDIMVNSSFNFYKNGRYEILMGDLDRGTWSLSADKKVLITIPDGGAGMQNMIDLDIISAGEVVLNNAQGPNPIRMVLVPQ
jgi:hypothetical protein